MVTLTVTAKGQVTLRREVMEHLGIKAGDKITVDKLPHGKVVVQAQPTGRISAAFGLLKRDGKPSVSIEEMNQVTAEGWAGIR